MSPLHPVSHRNVSFQPLPRPLGLAPYHYDLKDTAKALSDRIAQAGKMVFHVVGDSGGVQDGEFQGNVADAMIADLSGEAAWRPDFCYHVGDVVYFTGAHDDYYAQFYEPYAHYEVPIFAIPGNHDGEVDDPTAQTSLDGWVDYFMQSHPDVDPISKDAPRVQMDLPDVYWTLITPFATIVGLYTNVPEHGSVESVQQQWLTNELATAPDDRALIVALHHPIYSFDPFHSGSPQMADIVENAIYDTGRVPNLVLSGHVHNYQRIEKQLAEEVTVPFVISGNGGYHNLHAVNVDDGYQNPETKAVLRHGGRNVWGYLTLTVDGKTISGRSTKLDRQAQRVEDIDTFSYSASPIRIPKGEPLL